MLYLWPLHAYMCFIRVCVRAQAGGADATEAGGAAGAGEGRGGGQGEAEEETRPGAPADQTEAAGRRDQEVG